ncbi:alpha-(1,3)-fucosyltransferase fut-1-like [Pomacea canaliculata]|uniref:alpha-(1,3)-fucosyltransferase fut-1-like n=1 Tax=Pomacea canaliculata TaxID=400727 RepID=UPI000D7352F4|nr:alpha-(1,3)-fucosyltransferase fut-1-like [Pomacea canaliculata]
MIKRLRALKFCLTAGTCVGLMYMIGIVGWGWSYFETPDPRYPCVNNSEQDDLGSTYFVPQSIVLNQHIPLWQRHQTSQGILGYPVPLNRSQQGDNNKTLDEVQTFDHWPNFSKNYYKNPIPESPFHPNHTIRWQFDSSQLLKRPDVTSQPPKIITWMTKPRHIPDLPEPVRLRVCPEMPCRVTSNTSFREQSSALVWSVEHMSETQPPPRSFPDQVFVFHNLEPPRGEWVCSSTYRLDSWTSVFNWTMNYRFDADILSLHGLVVKRRRPVKRNYTDILARKTKFAAWAVSSVIDQSKRKQFAAMLQKYIPIDIFGENSEHKCPRDQDDACFQTFSRDYKFYMAFENSLCKDYISEKFFRYLNLDAVLVARGSNEYKFHAPPGIFINTRTLQQSKTSPTTFCTSTNTPMTTSRFSKPRTSMRSCSRTTRCVEMTGECSSCITSTRPQLSVRCVAACGTWTPTDRPFRMQESGLIKSCATKPQIYSKNLSSVVLFIGMFFNILYLET